MLSLLVPIFSSGFNPISFIVSSLIPDFFARLPIVSLPIIFDTSTPIPCNFSNVTTNLSTVFLLFIFSVSYSNSTKSFNNPVSTNGSSSFSTKFLPCETLSLAILSGNSICHKSIVEPNLKISCTSSICF